MVSALVVLRHLAMCCLLLTILGSQCVGALPASAAPVVAPNTVARAFRSASSAVVKLHGAGIGRLRKYGTGFLISSNGEILTTQSVLVTSRNLRAVLSDGREFRASVLRCDDYRQLALLKIEAEGLPHLNIIESKTLGIGDTIIAMGNWFKIAEGKEAVSVNRGILSLRTNLDAHCLAREISYHGPVLICDAITSNPGASGGPLLDVAGNCVGIIGRIAEAVSTNTRLNYALPSEEVLAFLGGEPSPKAISADGKPGDKGKPYVGIKISKLGFRHVSAYVERVGAGSPAADAGIRPDDLIVAIDGKRIADAKAYRVALKEMVPGQAARFLLKRGRNLIHADVTVGAKK